MTIYQKQMAYYSKKYAEKQKKARELVLAKAKDLIADPGKYTRATSIGAAGYIKNIKFVKETGKIPDGINLLLNLEKITEEEKYDGYYSIVTSEIICLIARSATYTKDYGKLKNPSKSLRANLGQGRSRLKMTKATAIQPRPAVIFSCQTGT